MRQRFGPIDRNPVLFLGETANNIPALYSLMNYADIALGTWYPKKGMHEIIKGMVSLAEEKGVQFKYNSEVEKIEVANGKAQSLVLRSGERIQADIIVAGADYHHVDKYLLDQVAAHHEIEADERELMDRALAENAVIVAQATPFFGDEDRRYLLLAHKDSSTITI